jgi:hypothetical protein
MADTRANTRMNRRVKTKAQWIEDTKILLSYVNEFLHMIGEINGDFNIVTKSQIILHPIYNFDNLYSYTSNIIYYLGESMVQEILIDCTTIRDNCPAEINTILFTALMSLVYFINESEYGKPFIETFSKPFTDDGDDFEAYFKEKEEQQKEFDDKMINTYKQQQEENMYTADYDPEDYVHERTVITRSDTLANLNKRREKMLQQLKDIIEIYDKIKKAAAAKRKAAQPIEPVIAQETTPTAHAEYVEPEQIFNTEAAVINEAPAELKQLTKPSLFERASKFFTRKDKVVPESGGGKRKSKRKYTKKQKSRKVRKQRRTRK